MRTTAAAAVFGLLTVTTLATRPAVVVAADGPAPNPAVAALVAQLGSPDYQAREKAGRDLATMGEKILPDLRRAADATDSPEVSRRLTVLIRTLERERLVSPRKVTLTAEDRPIKEIVDEIGKQTGYRVNLNGGRPDARVSVEFDKTPFWQALDKVALQAGLTVNPGYDEETVSLYSSDSINPYVAYAGPFRLVATSINMSRNIQLSGISPKNPANRNQEYLNLSLQMYAEPKNPILGTTYVEIASGEDENGLSLVPPKDPNNRYSSYHNPGYRTFNAYLNMNLFRPNRDATAIKHVKGRVGMTLLSSVIPDVVIPDPLKAKGKKFTGRTVQVEVDSITENGGGYSVSLSVSRVGGATDGMPDYAWSNNLWQKLELTDANGGKYRGFGYNSMSNNGGSVKMTIPFSPDNRVANPPKLGPAVRLVFNEWVSASHEVAFEFKDIPMP